MALIFTTKVLKRYTVFVVAEETRHSRQRCLRTSIMKSHAKHPFIVHAIGFYVLR